MLSRLAHGDRAHRNAGGQQRVSQMVRRCAELRTVLGPGNSEGCVEAVFFGEPEFAFVRRPGSRASGHGAYLMKMEFGSRYRPLCDAPINPSICPTRKAALSNIFLYMLFL
jgi:hypothetical protein